MKGPSTKKVPAGWIFRFLRKKQKDYGLYGDLEEIFASRMEKGKVKTYLWLYSQLLGILLHRIMDRLFWRMVMIRNYLKTAVRSFQRSRGYSLINLIGLAVGMACCLLIFMWVQDELSYDQYHEHAENIYRLQWGEQVGDALSYYALCPFGPPTVFHDEIPEIVAFTRLLWGRGLFTMDENAFEESNLYYVDPGFLDIFTCPFIVGDPASALMDANAIVLTESLALKWFGSLDILGKTVGFNEDGVLRITGVIRDAPRNSHFQYHALIPSEYMKQRRPAMYSAWDWIRGWAYVRLQEGADLGAVIAKMDASRRVHHTTATADRVRFSLQRVLDIHLRSHLVGEIGSNGSIHQVMIFSLVAFFILLLACINFMNLATARSANRSREVGMRKVLGAQRTHLIQQFLSESMLTAVISLLISLFIVALVLPVFNDLTRKALGFSSLFQGWSLAGVLFLVGFTGLLAGSYPAFVLSRFRPVVTLKKMMSKGARGSAFRNGLVVFQFSISVILTISMLVMLKQLNFMKSMDPGFSEENVLVLRLRGNRIQEQAETFKHAVLQSPNILQASVSDGIPGEIHTSRGIIREGQPQDEELSMNVIRADYDLLDVYGVEILHGRNFSKDHGSDASGAAIINKRAAKLLGWGEASVGQRIGFTDTLMWSIVGITEDFHIASLREAIGPLVILLDNSRVYELSMKISGDHVSETIAFVEETWKRFEPRRSLSYQFADESFDDYHRFEERLSRIVLVFAFLAVIIACLGLFGLAAYTVEQRTKEIGIRKTLGASVSGVFLLLSNGFLKWVLMANVIAWPLAYVVMERLLQMYAYRIRLEWALFILAGMVALLIAWIAVGYQSLKAAMSNPVDSLRYE